MDAIKLIADWDPRPGYALTPAERVSRKATMACKVFRHPHLERQQAPDPTPADGEVVVKIRNCGVCGSDTHSVETDADGYMIFSGPARFPCILGHEYSGEVVAVGGGVRNLVVGDLVTAEGMLYCGVCEACRKGWFNQCIRLDMVGFSSPGAYAEYIKVHEKHCWKLNGLAERLGSAALACEQGALVEPVGCSFNGMFVAAKGMTPGSHVAVFGCGPIGLGAIALARATGAATIVAFDLSPTRLDCALAMGADQALDVRSLASQGGSPSQIMREISDGWGSDMVIEAAGAAIQTMPEIERALAPAGKVVYLGRTGERAPVMLDILVSGASSIVGARGHAGGGVYPQIIRMLEHGVLDIGGMISHRMDLLDAAAAVQRSKTREDAKIMLVAS
ncbi:MAG: alcohol dehydrogenase catalytic domain-containing protein [Oligoflexia bacterium]|nr:alcohol dehydrogenase catalytic domain-containing protein [Oligoflexia bacterium]